MIFSLMSAMSRASPVEKILSSLTPDEMAYFIACTDIFHDKQYNVNGRPSASAQLQNCVTLNLSTTFTCEDFGLPTTQNWDLNIVSMPFITTQWMTNVIDSGYNLQLPAVPNYFQIGGLTAFAAPSGDATIPPTSSDRVNTLNANLALYPSYVSNDTNVPVKRSFYQILSMGFECINATPELYRSGSVIRYRVPTQGREVAVAIAKASFPDVWPTRARESIRCYPIPPTTSGFATQYPDSVIDEAVNGTYAMHTLQDSVSDFYVTGNERVGLFSPTTPTGDGVSNGYASSSLLNNVHDADPPLARGDFDMVGSYFTGLTPQSVIQIRYRVILSVVPSSSDTYLTSLAKMSPPENPKLNRLISLVQTEFLPGIPVGMNPKGEWWKIVLRGVAKIAPKLGAELGGPTGQLIGEGAAAVIKAAVPKQKKQNNGKGRPQSTAKTAPKKG